MLGCTACVNPACASMYAIAGAASNLQRRAKPRCALPRQKAKCLVEADAVLLALGGGGLGPLGSDSRWVFSNNKAFQSPRYARPTAGLRWAGAHRICASVLPVSRSSQSSPLMQHRTARLIASKASL